jgi:hypothetical protein
MEVEWVAQEQPVVASSELIFLFMLDLLVSISYLTFLVLGIIAVVLLYSAYRINGSCKGTEYGISELPNSELLL